MDPPHSARIVMIRYKKYILNFVQIRPASLVTENFWFSTFSFTAAVFAFVSATFASFASTCAFLTMARIFVSTSSFFAAIVFGVEPAAPVVKLFASARRLSSDAFVSALTPGILLKISCV